MIFMDSCIHVGLSIVPDEIVYILKCYVKDISEQLPGCRVLLFGSYAKGTFKKDSDIDIAVFLPSNYLKKDLIRIFRLLCRLSGRYSCDIQPQIFFLDEFYNPTGIVEEIVEYGIDISNINRIAV